jgi:hypothetical protein
MRDIRARMGEIAIAGALSLAGLAQACGGATASNSYRGAGSSNDAGGSSSAGTGTVSDGSDGGAIDASDAGSVDAETYGPCPSPVLPDASDWWLVSCSPVVPPSPKIATFDGVGDQNAFTDFDNNWIVGVVTTFGCAMSSSGVQFELGSMVTHLEWHVTGTVAGDMGFLVGWSVPTLPDAGNYPPGFVLPANEPLDVSGYAGIQFDVGGNAGPSGLLTLYAESDNQVPPSPSICGTCTGAAGACNVAATAVAAGIASTITTYQIRWTDLTSAGAPFDPTHLAGLAWFFPWTPGEPPYAVDVWVDNIEFIPRP